MAEFDPDNPEDRLVQEAEELMRQRRYGDAVTRYQTLRRQSPTDMWAGIGYVSALECAGRVDEAEKVLEETTANHRRSAPLHRFRRLFFVRREDHKRAALSLAALELEVVDEGPEDQLADLYFNQGRYHEARGELTRLLNDGVIDREERREMRASVTARVGACLRQEGELEPARERLIEALALEPGNHWTLSELAEAERALGNTEAARRRYREALEANGEDQWTRGHLAQLENEDGNTAAAIALYEEIVAAEPKAAWAKVELAQVVAEKDTARAHALLASALDNDPNYPWAHAQLGNLARRAGKPEEARKHYQRAAAAAPAATWVLHELADVCRTLGKMEEGYAHLEHAKGLSPYEAVTYGYFADFLRHEGKGPQAIAHLEKAVEIDDEYTWAWRELAELRALAGKHEDAEQAYHSACELEPDEAINDGLKAFLLRCQGRREAAIPWLERAVEISKDYLWAWRELADVHLAGGRAEQAEQVARRAVAALPGVAPLAIQLAEALRRQGKRSEAAEVAAKALEANPDIAHLWAIQAEVAIESGDHPAALRAARRAAELDHGAEYQALLAQVHLSAGDVSAAEPLVRQLMLAPQPSLAAVELSATLAERRGDLDQAIAICDRALAGAQRDDARLIVRCARLAAQRAGGAAPAAALAPLIALVERGTSGSTVHAPWRDAAQVFAASGRAALARRAIHLHLAGGGTQPGELAKSWLTLAELELSLGSTTDAREALARSLAHDPGAIPALILAAVLADQRGESDEAITHLETIEGRLKELGAPGEGPAGEAVLRRQLAALYERAGRIADAEAMWSRILADHPGHLPHRAEHACWLLRQGRSEDAQRAAAELLDELPAEGEAANEVQRLLKDLALLAAKRSGARAGISALTAHDPRLGLGNRLVLAQFALLVEDAALATRQLDLVEAADPGNRPARTLRVRLASQRRDPVGAERLARALWEEQRDDQEAAALLAECLAQAARPAEALAVLDEAAAGKPGAEAGLLAALIAGDHLGEAAALARLGRIAPPTTTSPLVRVLAAAWPGAWAPLDPTQPATISDLHHLPAFPALALHLSSALGRAGRHDLASALPLLVAAAVAERGDAPTARRLRAAAVIPLLAAGERRRAIAAAWAGRSFRGMLHCLRPW